MEAVLLEAHQAAVDAGIIFETSTKRNEISVSGGEGVMCDLYTKCNAGASPANVTPPAAVQPFTPYSLKEKLINLKAQQWIARAQVLDNYSKQLEKITDSEKRGFTMFDGYDTTWWIPTDRTTPIPVTRKKVEEAIRRDREFVLKFAKNSNNKPICEMAIQFIHKETQAKCRSCWDKPVVPEYILSPDDVVNPDALQRHRDGAAEAKAWS
jgi:hypothetical protein